MFTLGIIYDENVARLYTLRKNNDPVFVVEGKPLRDHKNDSPDFYVRFVDFCGEKNRSPGRDRCQFRMFTRE